MQVFKNENCCGNTKNRRSICPLGIGTPFRPIHLANTIALNTCSSSGFSNVTWDDIGGLYRNVKKELQELVQYPEKLLKFSMQRCQMAVVPATFHKCGSFKSCMAVDN